MDEESDQRHVDGQIGALAAVQHGVISAAQLYAIGLTWNQVNFRVRAGRLHIVERGVYAVGHPALTREGRWMAAVLACGGGAVLSHRPAAAHWGLLTPTSGMIDVTVLARSGRRSRARIAVHRASSLPDDEVTIRDGIPVPSVARTLLDLAAGCRGRTLQRAVEESERRRLFDLSAVTTLVDRYPRRRGGPSLRGSSMATGTITCIPAESSSCGSWPSATKAACHARP